MSGAVAGDAQAGDAQIAERGFQPYEGPRAGVAGSIRSVAWQSMRATLGIGRPARHKIFPVISAFIAYVPAIVFVGVAVILPDDILDPNEIADYPGYYGFITLAILLFAAMAAPEILISDRRNGMLAMYLSTPLGRGTYLAAKAIAVIATIGLVTLGPPMLLLAGYTVEGIGPDGPTEWLSVLGRIVLSGVAVSTSLTAISMAASSITDRRAFAAIGVVLLIIVLASLAGALVGGAEWSDNIWLIDPFSMSFELVYRIFGSDQGGFPQTATWAVLVSCVAWTAGGLGVVAWKYSRLVIAR